MTDPTADPVTVTGPVPAPDPDETTWDPEGEQLAALAPQTVTVDEAPARGAQHAG